MLINISTLQSLSGTVNALVSHILCDKTACGGVVYVRKESVQVHVVIIEARKVIPNVTRSK